jgi:hypothetical protein
MIKQALVFFLFSISSVSPDLIKTRDLFSIMNKSEENTLLMMKQAALCEKEHLLLSQAYLAAAEMSMAKYKVNPYSKITIFNKGKVKLEEVISRDTTNIELRYIRYTIQDNVPSILGYDKQMPSDKAYLLKHLPEIKKTDRDLFARVSTYLILRSKLNDEEKKLLEK